MLMDEIVLDGLEELFEAYGWNMGTVDDRPDSNGLCYIDAYSDYYGVRIRFLVDMGDDGNSFEGGLWRLMNLRKPLNDEDVEGLLLKVKYIWDDITRFLLP